jgi:biopolymer transport protein ExbD
MAMTLNTRPSRYVIGQNSTINITPFVDVMLVLMIIFMVAMPAATTSLELRLPPPRALLAPTPPPTIINIQPGGVFIGDAPTTLEALPLDLGRALHGATPAETRVYVRADRKVRYARFMAVMNTLQAGGFAQVGLVSEAL